MSYQNYLALTDKTKMKYFIVTKAFSWFKVGITGIKVSNVCYMFASRDDIYWFANCKEYIDMYGYHAIEHPYSFAAKVKNCLGKYPFVSDSVPFDSSELLEVGTKEITEEEFFVELVKLRLK